MTQSLHTDVQLQALEQRLAEMQSIIEGRLRGLEASLQEATDRISMLEAICYSNGVVFPDAFARGDDFIPVPYCTEEEEEKEEEEDTANCHTLEPCSCVLCLMMDDEKDEDW